MKPNWEVLHLHLKTLTWRNHEKCQQRHLGMAQTKAKETWKPRILPTLFVSHPSLGTVTRLFDPNPDLPLAISNLRGSEHDVLGSWMVLVYRS